MANRFEGKTVIVTGGNSGIGQATALAFANEGAKVVITGWRREALDETERLHRNIVGVVGDVQSARDANIAVEKAVEIGGGLDILVNNAGIATFEPVDGLTATSAALPSITQRQGAIINISSIVGSHTLGMGSAYAATKAAVNSLTRNWALELAPKGVRVNAISPGPVETPIFGKSGIPAEQIDSLKATLVAGVPLGRLGTSEEVAQWVLHAADPSATWLTGQVIGIDGGKGA